MNYDIKIINNFEGRGRIELNRIEFLAKHVKSVAQMALLLQIFGYSKVSLPAKLKKYLNIFLTGTQDNDGMLALTLDAENFKNLEYQFDLFKEKQELSGLTPMALVIKSFTAALTDDSDKNQIDEPLIGELLKFKRFFTSDTEKILMTNRSSIPEIEFSRKEMEKIEKIFKTIPAPEKTMVAGVIDEMKFSREQLILTTTENKKIVVTVAKTLFQEIKEFFGREFTISGMAYFKPGGSLSYVRMESFGRAGKSAQFFYRKPEKLTMQQQIALQLREGKKRNPIDDIIGKWPGQETDEEFDMMIRDFD